MSASVSSVQAQDLPLGPPVATIASNSERTQLMVIAVSMLGCGLLWLLGIISGWLFVLSMLGTALGLHWLTQRISTSRSELIVMEFGLKLDQRGKRVSFPYADVTSIAAKFTHHHLNHAYVATRAELTFEVDGKFQPFRFECDFRRGDTKQRAINYALGQCSESVQRRILQDLHGEGEVRWMEVRDHLKAVTNNGAKQVRQIVFEGKRFDVMSVRRWRAKALGLKQP